MTFNNTNDVRVFSGTASKYLADKISDFHGQPLGKMEMQKFKDGEMCPMIHESVRGNYVFFVQSTFPPADNLMELLLMIDAAKRASAKYITAVIPYFGYARQDRKDKARVSIGAKLVANMLTAAGADRVMTMDLHAGQIQGFFDIPVDHLQSNVIFAPYLNQIGGSKFTFAAPDVGGVKRAREYAKHFGTDLVICDKYREKANQVAGMTIIGDVEGKDVVLVDDLIDTAGTLTRAAQLILDNGATSVRAICTHPVLSGPAYERIEASPLEELIVTDTIPLRKESSKIKVLSTSKLFARAIKNICEHRSISQLFENEVIRAGE
jgi:ribose-phosphate pyrophosphokinase